MTRPLQILAVILVAVAAFFWWREDTDSAFAAGVLAAASYFLAMRFEMKARIKKAYEERAAASRPDGPVEED